MITFLLALVNSVNLRPSTRSDQSGYKPSTRGHGFICSTGGGPVDGITYDKKGRYYSITHHGCPNYEMKDWKCNADYKQCKNGTTYHCARDFITGAFTDACASPVFCGRGKVPIIQFPGGVPRIVCRFCDRNTFNDVNKSSDTYHVCDKKTTCREDEEIECEAAEGNASYWTQRRCQCNWKQDYIPTDLTARKPGYNFCLEDATCKYYKCNTTQDGKRQVRLSDYSCIPACDPGSRRINESTDCISTESENTTVAVHEFTKESDISLSKTNATELTTETPTSLSKTDATTDQTSNARTTQFSAQATQDFRMNAAGFWMATGIIALFGALFGLSVWCYMHKSGKTTDERRKKSDNNHNTNPPGTPECVRYNINSIEIRWAEPREADDNETQLFIGTYVIEKREVRHQDWERVQTVSCNSCTIHDLEPETSYQFQVATFHNGNTGTFSQCSDLMRTQQPAIAPEICTRPRDITALKGTDFTNRVEYKGIPVPKVIWKKGDVVLEDIQDRLMFKKNDVLEECTMEVKSAERNDSGNYKVILRNETGQCEKPFQIIVKDVPSMPVGPLSIKCLPESERNEYQLTWKPPEDNGGSEIDNYIVEEKGDTGKWHTYISYVRDTSCIFCLDHLRKTYNFRVMAKNEQGISEACEMETPLVLSAPKVNKVKDFVAVEGGQCIIAIPYDGVPQPDVYWTKNGLQVEEEHGRVYHKNDQETISLELNPTVKNDAGKYGLKLKNLLGHDEVSFNIQIKYKPGKPEGPLEVKQMMSKTFLLEWRPPTDTGGSEIKKYIVEKRSSTGRWEFEYATIGCSFYLTEERNYLFFRVMAKNEQGIGDPLEMDKPFVQVSGGSVTTETEDRTHVNRTLSAPDKTQYTGLLMSEKTEHYRNICVSGKEAGTLPQPAPVFSLANKPVLKDNLAETSNGKDNADAKNISFTVGTTRFTGKLSGSFKLENEEETLSYKQKKRPSSRISRQESGGGNCLDSSVEMLDIRNEYNQDQDDDETFKSLKK